MHISQGSADSRNARVRGGWIASANFNNLRPFERAAGPHTQHAKNSPFGCVQSQQLVAPEDQTKGTNDSKIRVQITDRQVKVRVTDRCSIDHRNERPNITCLRRR
jgi:hypothetical protein